MVRVLCSLRVESYLVGLQPGEVPEQDLAVPPLALSANVGENALTEDPELLLPASRGCGSTAIRVTK